MLSSPTYKDRPRRDQRWPYMANLWDTIKKRSLTPCGYYQPMRLDRKEINVDLMWLDKSLDQEKINVDLMWPDHEPGPIRDHRPYVVITNTRVSINKRSKTTSYGQPMRLDQEEIIDNDDLMWPTHETRWRRDHQLMWSSPNLRPDREDINVDVIWHDTWVSTKKRLSTSCCHHQHMRLNREVININDEASTTQKFIVINIGDEASTS